MKKFRSRILASALSVGLAVSSVPMTAFAAADLPVDDKDGYTLAWSDEFDDEELSLDDWNVEAHDPGWVNAELQRYVNKDEMSGLQNATIEKLSDRSNINKAFSDTAATLSISALGAEELEKIRE